MSGEFFLKVAKELGIPAGVLTIQFAGLYLLFVHIGVPAFNRGWTHVDKLDDSLGKQTGVLVDMRASQSEEVIRDRIQEETQNRQEDLLIRQDASQIRQEALLRTLIEKME